MRGDSFRIQKPSQSLAPGGEHARTAQLGRCEYHDRKNRAGHPEGPPGGEALPEKNDGQKARENETELSDGRDHDRVSVGETHRKRNVAG